MSTFTSPTSPYGPRYRSRKAERRMLARALRLRDRRRRFDQFQYRYRHVVSVLASGFLATTVLVVLHTVGVI